jgi:hypothetical protein
MGKAKWWVCGSCHSLNDLPANKCYKCRAPKGPAPRLIDDTYSEVGGAAKRVSVSIDRSRIGELSQRDPIEDQQGAGIVEAFGPAAQGDRGDRPAGMPPTQRSYSGVDPGQEWDPVEAAGSGPAASGGGRPRPQPLREPERRGIEILGVRPWAEPATPPSSSGSDPSTPPPEGPKASNADVAASPSALPPPGAQVPAPSGAPSPGGPGPQAPPPSPPPGEPRRPPA